MVRDASERAAIGLKILRHWNGVIMGLRNRESQVLRSQFKNIRLQQTRKQLQHDNEDVILSTKLHLDQCSSNLLLSRILGEILGENIRRNIMLPTPYFYLTFPACIFQS
jgi:hypothetical protein